MEIVNIIYEDINKDFGFGKYGDFKVVIMKKNGYINATKLCSSGERRFKNWTYTNNSQELINEVSSEYSDIITDFKPIIIVDNNHQQELRGTYVHPDLITHIASWVSAKFAIKVSKIVNSYFVREYKMKNDELVKQMQNMSETMKRMEEQNNKLLEQNEGLKKQNEHTHKQNNKLSERIIKLQTTSNDIQNKLEDALEDRVVKTQSKSKDEYLAVIRNESNSYYVIRRQRCSIKNAIKSYIINNKNSKLIFISWNPNAVNNFNRMKEKEYVSKIIINGNTLRLRNISENEFIKLLYKVNDDKYDQNKKRLMDNYINNMIEEFEIDYDDDICDDSEDEFKLECDQIKEYDTDDDKIG